MGLFHQNFDKPGPGVSPDAPRKKGAARFFEILGRDFSTIWMAGLLALISSLPFALLLWLAVSTHSLIPLLAAVEESDDIDGLLLLLNTVGGDIEAGLAIAELIAGMKKPTVSLVLGGGHSIGIPLAVSAKRAIIAPRASMTVHPVRMTGLVVGAPQTYHYFDQIQDHIVDFVTENSRISREDFERYMMATGNMATDVGTVLYGAEAVKSGLMDELGTLSDALSYLHRQIARGKKRRGESNGETNG